MKHKHKFYPTNEVTEFYIDSERKWVCECGETKWVEER